MAKQSTLEKKADPEAIQETPALEQTAAGKASAVEQAPAGKVHVPDEQPPTKSKGLQLTAEIEGWLKERNLPADENGLKMILGHIDKELVQAHHAPEKARQAQSAHNLGNAKTRIRDRVHRAVEEQLKDYSGNLNREQMKILKELAWAVTDQSLLMSAAMNQAHTAEQLSKSRAADRQLWSLLRDPQYEPLLDQAFEIQDLSDRTGIPTEKIAEIARVFQPRRERYESHEPTRRTRPRGHTEVGGGFPIDEGNSTYDKIEKAMDSLLQSGRNPSEVFKKHASLFK